MGSGHQPRAHWTGLGAVPPEQPVGLTGLDPHFLSVGAGGAHLHHQMILIRELEPLRASRLPGQAWSWLLRFNWGSFKKIETKSSRTLNTLNTEHAQTFF